jgi:hypothetical protein
VQKQTIDLEIDLKIFAAAGRVLRGPYDAYIATADRLTWSNPTITALVHQQAAGIRESIASPHVAPCAQMRGWAASGFHRLPPGSKSLEEARQAREKQATEEHATEGDLGELLRPSEVPAERTIARRITALERKLNVQEHTHEVESNAGYRLELALGEKPSRFASQRHAPAIATGRTHAGTKFVIRTSAGETTPASCKHEVQVEVRKGHSASGSGICLSEGPRPRPSSECSGPVETIEFATPPDVRRVRVRLSNGRTVTASTVPIPVKDGGPMGVFIDAFRGYDPYPVSAQELNSNGRVIRTVSLRGVRCRKEPAGGGPESPQFVNLATVMSPYGEPLNIEAILDRFHGQTELSLISRSGIRNSERREEQSTPRQFQWQLSTECAPHPYTLLDGILLTPGASVLARTPAGLTPLTKVDLAASTHAEGPFFYGVYTTPPTEIVVESSNGSILYTESLAAKATEETEFCEGYAEQ